MEIKLNVSIGATLQVKNAKGEWDWIKPEVGAELKLIEGEVQREFIQEQFSKLWDNVVGPQFRNVVSELLNDEVVSEEVEDGTKLSEGLDATETTVSDDEDYY